MNPLYSTPQHTTTAKELQVTTEGSNTAHQFPLVPFHGTSPDKFRNVPLDFATNPLHPLSV